MTIHYDNHHIHNENLKGKVAIVGIGETRVGKHPDKTVLTVALAELAGSRGSNWEIMTAAAFVSIAVPLLVFFALQRYFVRGLMAGSVRG